MMLKVKTWSSILLAEKKESKKGHVSSFFANEKCKHKAAERCQRGIFMPHLSITQSYSQAEVVTTKSLTKIQVHRVKFYRVRSKSQEKKICKSSALKS